MMRPAVALLASALLTGPAWAQEVATDAAEAAETAETEMRDKTRSLGYSIGNTYACTEDAAKDAFEAEAHVIFDMILKDVGSDLAFVYATAAGYGASLAREDLDCARLFENWGQVREEFGLADVMADAAEGEN